MNYLGMSFIVPTLVSFAAFATWLLVLSRMTNLKIKWYWRLLVLGWMLMMLFAPIMDLNREHKYDSPTMFVSIISRMTVFRLGIVLLAVWIYRLLPMAYPIRAALSSKEPASALHSTENFMATDGSELHKPLSDATPSLRMAKEKAKTKELAVVVATVADARDAVKEAESATHKAGEAVAQVDKAAKVAVSNSPSMEEK